MKRFDWNTIISWGYVIVVLLVCLLGIVFVVGEIVFTFKTLTSSEIPFWLKWVLITRGK